MPDAWVKLLFTYGPFALLVLLIFVVERKVWGEVRCTGHNAPVRLVYGATWIAIFVTCGVIVWVWVHNNVSQGETMIRGSVTGLKAQESLLSRSENMYIRRVYTGAKTADFAFRIISPKKLTGSKPTLTIVHDEDNQTRYALPIEDSFYAEDMEITLIYDQVKNRLRLQKPDGKETELANIDQPNADLAPQPASLKPGFPAQWLAPWTVYAQKSKPLAVDVLDRLDSPDAILRMDARSELIQGGKVSSQFVASVLYDPGSSNRQLAGALTALNNSPALAEAILKPSGMNDISKIAACTVKQLAEEGEGTVKVEAAKLFSARQEIAKEKTCNPIPGRSFTCKGARLVRLHSGVGIQRITAGKQHAYLVQTELSPAKVNISTVYVIQSELPDWPVSGNLDKKEFKSRFEAKLQPVKGLRLQPETYVKREVKNGDTLSVVLSGGGEVKVYVRETKYSDVPGRTDFMVCVP